MDPKLTDFYPRTAQKRGILTMHCILKTRAQLQYFCMVRRLPARRSSDTFSVVRKKTGSIRGISQVQRSTRTSSGKNNWIFIHTGTRVLLWATLIGVGISLVGYILFQVVVQQALRTGTQTVLLVPSTVDDAAPAQSQAPHEIWVVALAQNIVDSKILSLPADTPVELPGGYGSYRLGAVYPLLQLEGKDTQFVRASYSQSLGILTDLVIPLNQYERGDSAVKRKVLESVWQWLVHRDQSALIFLKTWLFLKQQPQPKPLTSVTELQKGFSQFESTRQQVQECPVGILNGSETAGAAGKLSKLLEAGKIVTIRVGTFPEDASQTKIYHDGRAECAGVLARTNSALLQGAQIEIDKQMTTQYRSAIVVVLGKDLQ